MESKCSPNQPKCGYYAGKLRLSEHWCNMVGCASKHGAVGSHMQEKYPNCKGNHTGFSAKRVKKIEAITMVRQSRRVQPNERVTSEATGANRVEHSTT